MRKLTQQAVTKIKGVKNSAPKSQQKIATNKTRSIKKNRPNTSQISRENVAAGNLKENNKIYQSNSIKEKWTSLVSFLFKVLKDIFFIVNTIVRVVHLIYIVIKALITSIWFLIKGIVPLVIKGFIHVTLEIAKYINIFVPKCWHYLKINIPLLITWLEKELPIFLLNLAAWLKKNTPILINWIEEKFIYLYDHFKLLLKVMFNLSKACLVFVRKNYPVCKQMLFKYLKLGIIFYKKYKPLSYKSIKNYFEIKDHSETRENLKDFVTDADHYILHQEPIRGMLIIRVALVSSLILIIWAALTQVDDLVKGDGKVVPSSQLQILQSLDGGVIKSILVKEGDEVKAGQALVEIDTTRFLSSVKENVAQRIALSARAERINALLENRPFIFPSNLSSEDKEAYKQEERYFVNAKIQLDNQIAASAQQLISAQRELRLTKPLLSSGAVSEVEVLRLEREVVRLRGLREQAEFEFKNNLRKDLSDTMAKLNSLSEGSVGLEDRVKQSVIRSPLDGFVKRLYVNTIGGVIGAAKDIVEVVPSEDNLSIEAKVQPKDIGFLRVGQKALVKLTAYDFSIYGGLEAVVDSIGADSITDEKGNAYYIVKVKTHKLQLKKNLPIIPGMQAEVDIQTGSKSILTYLLKPILRAKQIAFTER